MQLLKQEPLKHLTSFQVGGPADIYIPETIEELKELVVTHPGAFFLGGGTKVLFPDEGLATPVILTTRLNTIEDLDAGIKVQAGARISKLFDFATGVAVTAGGALWNNFGAFGYEIGPFVDKVRILTAQEDKWLTRKELSFSYRWSSLKEKKQLVAEVIFNKKQLRHAAAFLRQRRENQPLTLPCAGSIFKNPNGHYAGKLIEDCGLKGRSIGDAVIWEKHGNFIINKGQATCAEIKSLIALVRQKVREKFNMELELELQVYSNGAH